MKKNKTKKIFMSLGTMAMVVAPVASAISCGTNNKVDHYKLLPTYTGQADQLIALGIKADYYPWQLEKTAPFDYLTNAQKYISKNHTDKDFAQRFTDKVKSLIPDDQGTSWWNQQALEDGEKGSNPEYWTHKGGDMVLYEHYLLDDGAKTIDNAQAPKHNNNAASFIETNFRQSRDPFTRIPQDIIEGLVDQSKYDILTEDKKNIVKAMLNAAREAEIVSDTKTAVDGEKLPTGILKDDFEFKEDKPGSWWYNDYVFAKNYHGNFLDNSMFKNTSFSKLTLDATKDWIFDANPDKNKKLAELFYKSTYKDEEAPLKALMSSQTNPQNTTATLAHHPIYDQQTSLGSAPMFEGAQRDNSLYLYDLASKLQKATTDELGEGYKQIKKAFNGNAQWVGMTKALINADQIEKDLQARQAKIAALVAKITAKRGEAPKFGVATVAPGGQGVSTVQSSSKYSFLYRELGFAQPLPKDLPNLKIPPANGGNGTGNTLYNMDDNGWWWNISQQDAAGDSTGIDSSRTQLFANQFDYGVLAINDQDWSGSAKGSLKADDKAALNVLFKSGSAEDHKVDYNLWNEGLKTPFVMHMILDNVLDQISAEAISSGASQADVEAAYDWGTYFTTTYLA